MKKIVSFFGDNSEIFSLLNKRAEEYARSKGLEYHWFPQVPYNKDIVIQELQNATAGIIDVEPYGEDIFSQIDKTTRILVRFGVGYDKVDLNAASRHHIAIARTTGANTMGVAEMALTLILAMRRKLKLGQEMVDRGAWEKYVVPETVGATIGILGFGAIGQALTRLLQGLNCKIIAYDPYPKKEVCAELGVELVSLEVLFKNADAISMHLPYGPETHNLIGKKLLELMKPSAVIVNTSRGNILDEAALYEVLKNNKIGGAALDVYSQEPLPVSSPLIGLDNVILTPHVSSQTEESLWRIYRMAIDIISDFLEGRDYTHILNRDWEKQ